MGTREEVVKETNDLQSSYKSNAFLLLTMGLRLGTVDYEQLYRDNVLDGPDDKKLDFSISTLMGVAPSWHKVIKVPRGMEENQNQTRQAISTQP